jgi:demethylmenaquinone methyltransferase/2-methoxy-6-polyprenyl-1,4-benzoquinol methylase
VNDVFSSVSAKYDVMNDVMSLGVQRLWKKKFVEGLDIKNDDKILDLASGTGDIAFAIRKNYPHSHIIVSDVNEDMLNIAKEKALEKGLYQNLEFKIINAEKIPLKNESLDVATISFGIRNVANIPQALQEVHRVLKAGGKFYIMEFSKMLENEEGYKKYLGKFYEFYSMNILPKLGKVIAKDEDSYRYLAESIKTFPDAEEFKTMLEEAGFHNVSYEKLIGEGVAIHRAEKNDDK